MKIRFHIFSGSGTCGSVSSDQDAEVLRNAYRDLKKVNGITVDCNLQKAAQSVKQCVWNHSQHKGADKLVSYGGGLVYQEVH